ncbi:50S ribosomal protein L18e [Candidatus Pacearchaeota archaeon]|nr:50S ribosomal protein L18e [Candidatus Pacearchaeota archaeon]|tara:strand:- start:737 stop:1120 length:384 start_codon:yes stop_codon:yes gene_type:complete
MKKTQIEKKLKRKTNSELVETVIKSKKNENWLKISHLVSGSVRKKISLNLRDINEQSKDGDKVVVPGKVLSDGKVEKKISISALSFSERAREKLKESKIPTSTLLEEIKKNPKAEKIKLLDKRIKRY